jgi:hypothetical protein
MKINYNLGYKNHQKYNFDIYNFWLTSTQQHYNFNKKKWYKDIATLETLETSIA